MSSHREENDLATALRELRPAPRPEFAEQLDARAAAGFPRERGAGSAADGRLTRVARRLGLHPSPRRKLVGAGGLALAGIVVATAVIAASENRTSGPATGHSAAVDSRMTQKLNSEIASSATTGATQNAPPRFLSSRGATHPETAGAKSSTGSSAIEFEGSAPTRSGPYAARYGNRDVERTAAIVLSADPSSVHSDSAEVFEAVHANNGIVLHSTIRDGSHGDAGASFDLLIPSARLDDALAAFSGIAAVRSRHESTEDITAPTIGVGERLQDSHARVESLLAELAGADTETERARAEAELRSERNRAAALRSRLSTLQRRANLSRVSLRIETGNNTGSEGGAGGWGIGDGFDAAGRILAIAAGVAVIGLALLAPLLAIALLGWLAHRAWLRRARANALA